MAQITSTAQRAGMHSTVVHTVTDVRGPGEVNFRTGRLWRGDRRYPGDWMVRRHESGGVEMTFTGSQHNSKDVVKVIAAEHVDKLILSLLEVRAGAEKVLLADQAPVPYRYEVQCEESGCPEPLDLSTHRDDALTRAQEHADRFGHRLIVHVRSAVQIQPSEPSAS